MFLLAIKLTSTVMRTISEKLCVHGKRNKAVIYLLFALFIVKSIFLAALGYFEEGLNQGCAINGLSIRIKFEFTKI